MSISVNWKVDFLTTEENIESFLKRRLQATEPGNVVRLLRYHLERSMELIWAEVNGGLDEEYQAEVDKLLAGPSA